MVRGLRHMARMWPFSLGLLIAAMLVISSCGGVVTTTGAPSSTTAPAVQSTTTEKTTTSDQLPVIGTSVTLKSMTQATIPAGKLMEMLEFGPKGNQNLRLVIDPQSHKGFREMVDTPNAPPPGFDFLVFDDGGHSEMGSISLQVDPYGGANFTDIVEMYDNLQGKSAKIVGYETVDGQQTFVVETTFTGGEAGVTASVQANVDAVTGLVVREDWDAGTSSQLYERRVIDQTPELLKRMDIQAMSSIVAGYQELRVQSLKGAAFPVYGLPAGYRDLPLSSAIPFPDGRMVKLEYGVAASGNYISVTTLDPKKYPGYRKEYLAPVDHALLIPGGGGAGDRAELRFGIGEVGVQIQAPKDIIKQVARDLIVVGGPGNP